MTCTEQNINPPVDHTLLEKSIGGTDVVVVRVRQQQQPCPTTTTTRMTMRKMSLPKEIRGYRRIEPSFEPSGVPSGQPYAPINNPQSLQKLALETPRQSSDRCSAKSLRQCNQRSLRLSREIPVCHRANPEHSSNCDTEPKPCCDFECRPHPRYLQSNSFSVP